MSKTLSARETFINQSFWGDSEASTPATVAVETLYLPDHSSDSFLAPSYQSLLLFLTSSGTWSNNQSKLSTDCCLSCSETYFRSFCFALGIFRLTYFDIVPATISCLSCGNLKMDSEFISKTADRGSSILFTPVGYLVLIRLGTSSVSGI